MARLAQRQLGLGPEIPIWFEVTPSGGTNGRPGAPMSTGPGDWAVYTSNQSFTLQAAANGDPDGDAITGYYFELLGAHPGNSGWLSIGSWSPAGLTPDNYAWRVKVRDARGAGERVEQPNVARLAPDQ